MSNYIGEEKEKRLNQLLMREEDITSVLKCMRMIEDTVYKYDDYLNLNTKGIEEIKRLLITRGGIEEIKSVLINNRNRVQAELYRIMKDKEDTEETVKNYPK